MTLAHKLYQRFQQLIHEMAKFGVVGGIAFLVTTVGTNLLHFDLGFGPLKANIVATIVATCVSYAGNRWWTFRHREGSTIAREYVVFFVLNGIGLGIQLACISIAYYVLGLHDKLSYNVALIFGIGLGTLFRFWSYRKWVWLAPPAEPVTAETGGTVPPGQPLATGPATGPQPAVGRYAPVEVTPEVPHTNGHAGADQAAGDGSFSRT